MFCCKFLCFILPAYWLLCVVIFHEWKNNVVLKVRVFLRLKDMLLFMSIFHGTIIGKLNALPKNSSNSSMH